MKLHILANNLSQNLKNGKVKVEIETYDYLKGKLMDAMRQAMERIGESEMLLYLGMEASAPIWGIGNRFRFARDVMLSCSS